MRYPLFDWHGNNGNVMGDGPAAMRYTETRLAKIACDGMLAGIKKKNVDFKKNFDETEDEPVTLPALFPNLLCNPNTGIGVAIACSWLPHNLNEVAQAVYDYLDGMPITLPGPDFPTGGIIINKNDIPAIMQTGHGSVKVRGKYKIEDQKLVFYEIPYGVTVENLLTEIGEVCDSKEIEGVKDIRNESNKKGLRIVIETIKGVNPESIVNKLFAKTDLQTSISYNQVALVNKTPTELNLSDCIKIYVDHNIDCIKREVSFDLEKAKGRLEIVEGLLIALEDIDNIITLIKKSKSAIEAKENLIARYNLSENQAKAILDMKLAKLANLEQVEVQEEKKSLMELISTYEILLVDDQKQKDLLRTRLQELVKKYGDKRRTELTQIDIKPEDKEIAEIVPEDCVVIMTQTGNIKRVAAKSFKPQRRNGKGVKNEDDALLGSISTNTVDTLMLFTNLGKMYKIVVDSIPEGTSASKGINVSGLISLDKNEKVVAITSLYRKTNAKYVVFFTKNGLLKKTSLEEYTSIKRSTGTIAIKLKENDSIANVTFLADEDVIIITKKGMSINFETKDIAPIGRVTSGVKAIKLAENDEVLVGLPIRKRTDSLAVFTEQGFGKKMKLEDFPLQNRGGKGVIIHQEDVVGAAMVDDEDVLLLVGKPNSICVKAIDIPMLSRTGNGNIMIKNSYIKTVVKL